MWSMPEGEEIREFRGQNGLLCCEYIPWVDRLLTGGWDGTARVWDLATGEALSILPPFAGDVRGLACDEER
eukprot:759160-Prorocentrum_lima.AAC.1